MNSSIHVLCLPFFSHIRSKLICCGFATTEDFCDLLDVEKLKQRLIVTEEEAGHILNVVRPYCTINDSFKSFSCPYGVWKAHLSETVVFESVAHLLKTRLRHVQHIVSFSSRVDKLLGGGFPLGKITEIAGEAGFGKTQFCFQLCVDVQIPDCLGGIGAEAVFVDVEGTFCPQRVKQIAKAAVQHCRHIAGSCGGDHCLASVEDFTVEEIMSHIYLFRCCNSVQLLAATHQMREFLHSHPKVKLLVIDSVAQCFRGEDDFRSRSKFLSTLGRILYDLTEDLGLSIVVTNQVATKIGNDASKHNIPALGLRWSHFASVKLMLHKVNSSRFMYQYKSAASVDGIAEFSVSVDGIRDAQNLQKCDKLHNQCLDKSTSREASPSALYFYPVAPSQVISGGSAVMDCAQSRESSRIQFCAEDIPSKWIELSQRELESEPVDITNSKGHSALNFDDITLVPTSEGSSKCKKNAQTILKSCGKVQTTVETTLRRTVDAMLSSDFPVKAPPKRRRELVIDSESVVASNAAKAIRSGRPKDDGTALLNQMDACDDDSEEACPRGLMCGRSSSPILTKARR